MSLPRRGGRAVECTALEMRHTGNRIEGSNPSLSAIPVCVIARDIEPSIYSAPRFCHRQSEERKERARRASAMGSNPSLSDTLRPFGAVYFLELRNGDV